MLQPTTQTPLAKSVTARKIHKATRLQGGGFRCYGEASPDEEGSENVKDYLPLSDKGASRNFALLKRHRAKERSRCFWGRLVGWVLEHRVPWDGGGGGEKSFRSGTRDPKLFKVVVTGHGGQKAEQNILRSTARGNGKHNVPPL